MTQGNHMASPLNMPDEFVQGYLKAGQALVQAFSGIGFTLREDRSAFARATQVEFGRDKLADFSLGANWKFQPKCTLRAQWLYSRNDSNIAIYDFSRNEISSTIRCDFE